MANKRKIYFRADAGSKIGYGHYIRSLALADMLKQDFDCTMFTQMPTDYQLRECESVCPIVVLPDDDSKFDKFLEYLNGDEIVVLDNYFFTTDYQRAIKAKGCQLVCIDDMHDKHYVADVVINHGCTDRTLFDVESYTRLCLGMEYALLRSPFRNPIKCDIVPNSYAICFGGADPENLTLQFAEQLIKSQWVEHIYAIVGDGYKYEDALKTLPNVEIRKRLSADEIASLFCSVENVICSASTTCYEALACGARVYAGWYVENQKESYNLLKTNNQIVPLDNLCEVREISPTAIKPVCFPKSYNALWRVFVQLAWRVVDYRDLTEDESRVVLEYRNNDDVRKWMKNSQLIPLVEHENFIKSLKNNNSKRYYAFFIGNTFLASYNYIDIANGRAEAGIYLNPKYEGRGLASLIENTMEKSAIEMGIHYITSEVRHDNHASVQYLLRNGYHLFNQDDEFVYFEKVV